MLARKPGKCRHCKTRLERLGAVICVGCIEPYLAEQSRKKTLKEKKEQRAKAKVERAKDRATRERLKKISELIADAQVWCNRYIRMRDRHKGCFVCGCAFSEAPGKVMHAGHVRSRGAAGHLRFNEDNILGECEGCNGPRGAKPHEIKAGAIARIGLERFEALENDNTPHKWGRQELIDKKAYFKAKCKELEAQHG